MSVENEKSSLSVERQESGLAERAGRILNTSFTRHSAALVWVGHTNTNTNCMLHIKGVRCQSTLTHSKKRSEVLCSTKKRTSKARVALTVSFKSRQGEDGIYDGN